MGKFLFFLLVFDRILSAFRIKKREPISPGWENIGRGLFKTKRKMGDCPEWNKRIEEERKEK